MIVPKRFVSICARKSDIGVSFTGERLPHAALLITTSSEPQVPIAAFTALAAADSSVTSSAKSLIWSPWRTDRSCRDSMSLAVANTLLPAARPASTIARPRPRELPVTNHTCAIRPSLWSPQYSGEAYQTQDWMRDGYTKGLVSYGGNRRIFRPQGDPLSSRVIDCVATPLALASSWKSKGAARRIVKDKGSGLINPSKPAEKELISTKNWKILMRRNSDRPACVATRQRPGEIDLTPAI